MKSLSAQSVCRLALCATLTVAMAGCITPSPRVAPPSGIYACPETVTITESKASAAIFYTTDGSSPTTSSTKYTGPFAVSTTDKVRAIALAPGETASRVAEVSYVCRFNRGDFAVLLQRRFALPPPKQPVVFFDIKPTDSIYNAVEAAAPFMNPLVLCPGCSLSRDFNPDQPITRAISTIAIVRILAARGKLQFLGAAESDKILAKSPDAKQIPSAARPYFATAIARGIISFGPEDRIELATPNKRIEIDELVERLQREFKLSESAPQ